jgi:hypothetical protein
MGTGDPLMPANPLGMGLGQILDPPRVVGLFAGIIYIRGDGFGIAKPNGFEPIAIPKQYECFERDERKKISAIVINFGTNCKRHFDLFHLHSA